jgi:regulator of sigma E protease
MILALLLTAFFLVAHGTLDVESTRIGEIMPGYPAERAGIQVGDEVRSVNDQAVASWKEMSEAIRNQAMKGPVVFQIDRSGFLKTLTVDIPNDSVSGVPVFGIRPSLKRYPPHHALSSAFGFTISMSVEMIRNIGLWISGKSAMDVAGPVGIASMAGDAARRGWWTFISFLALISLNLGLLNLFPFPALDGGRLVFILGEIVTGKRIPEKTEGFIHYVGFIILIGLIVFITWNDISKIFFSK